MKAAYINQPLDNLFPPHQNSIGIWTYRVAPHVAESIDVEVYGRRSNFHNQAGIDDKVKYNFYPIIPHKLTRNLKAVYELSEGGGLPDYAAGLYYAEYILQVAQNVRRKQIDIVHIHNFTQFVPYIRKISPGSKIVLHMNCEWLSQLDYGTMEDRIAQTDLIVGSSDHIANLVRQRFSHYQDRCFTLYNGVDASLFKPKSDAGETVETKAPRILFVGRVSPEKGVHDLIRTFLQVIEKYPDAHLDIVGPVGAMPLSFLVGVSDDPIVGSLTEWYREDYFTLLKELIPANSMQKIRFHGGVSQTELVQFYQNADILINPSYSESFGMSLVEAMACEKPVIASIVGGMIEIVDNGKFGILVERGDIEALAQGIIDLFNDPERRLEMGQKGRERVLEYFDWPQIANRALKYYESIS